MIISIDRLANHFLATSETGNEILDSLETLHTWFNKETATSSDDNADEDAAAEDEEIKDAPVMSNTVNQTVNDYSIDTFYFMDNKGIEGDRSEPLYRSISWIEDDNEAHY